MIRGASLRFSADWLYPHCAKEYMLFVPLFPVKTRDFGCLFVCKWFVFVCYASSMKIRPVDNSKVERRFDMIFMVMGG